MEDQVREPKARAIAIEFINSFNRDDFDTRAEYARFCAHRQKYRIDGTLPSVKTITQIMTKKGYEIIYVKK